MVWFMIVEARKGFGRTFLSGVTAESNDIDDPTEFLSAFPAFLII